MSLSVLKGVHQIKCIVITTTTVTPPSILRSIHFNPSPSLRLSLPQLFHFILSLSILCSRCMLFYTFLSLSFSILSTLGCPSPCIWLLTLPFCTLFLIHPFCNPSHYEHGHKAHSGYARSQTPLTCLSLCLSLSLSICVCVVCVCACEPGESTITPDIACHTVRI